MKCGGLSASGSHIAYGASKAALDNSDVASPVESSTISRGQSSWQTYFYPDIYGYIGASAVGRRARLRPWSGARHRGDR
jgi:hypothetical protein